MALTLDDVKRVARLARIAVNEDESQAALAQLSGIFQLIEQMQAVDTANVEPMSHAQEIMRGSTECRITSWRTLSPDLGSPLRIRSMAKQIRVSSRG